MKNKTILIIGSFKLPKNGHFGGVYFATTSLSDGLTQKGIKIIPLDTTLKDINKTSVFKRLPNIVGRSFYFLFSILKNHQAKQLFVFLSGGGSYIDKFLPVLTAKLLQKKVILFPRSGHIIPDWNNFFYKPFIWGVLKKSNVVICQSLFWRKFFEKNRMPTKELYVIENWVPDSTIQRSRTLGFKKTTESNSSIFKVIFISRIEKEKGALDIIELAKKLKFKNNVELNVFGAGSFTEEFLRITENSNLTDVIKYKGWLNKIDMQEIINTHHLGLFLSKTEGYPNVLLDYIFSKIPILSSDIPMAQAVGGKFMLYFKNGDIEDLEKKINFAIENYDLLIESSKKLYKEKFERNNIKTTVNKVLKIIDE